MRFDRATLRTVEKLSGRSDNPIKLWTSKNGNWIIFLIVNSNYLEFYDVEQHSNYVIGVSNEWFSDYPIKYYDGKIGYYSPEAIPKYVRAEVEKMAKKIGQFKGKVFDNPDFDTILAMIHE